MTIQALDDKKRSVHPWSVELYEKMHAEKQSSAQIMAEVIGVITILALPLVSNAFLETGVVCGVLGT